MLLLQGRIYIALGPWHFGAFCYIFLPNVGEDHQKSQDFSGGPLAGTAPYCDKSGLGSCIAFIKRLDVILR